MVEGELAFTWICSIAQYFLSCASVKRPGNDCILYFHDVFCAEVFNLKLVGLLLTTGLG
jgi:hypothetical protein